MLLWRLGAALTASQGPPKTVRTPPTTTMLFLAAINPCMHLGGGEYIYRWERFVAYVNSHRIVCDWLGTGLVVGSGGLQWLPTP